MPLFPIMKRIILIAVCTALNNIVYSQPFGDALPEYIIAELHFQKS